MRRHFTFLDCVLILFPIALVLQIPIDPDMGWHLRVGQDIWRGVFPYQDMYTWSMPGYVWVDHEWLTDAIMFFLNRFTGLLGMAVLFIVIALGAYLIAARTGALISRYTTPGSVLASSASWRLGAVLLIVALIVNNDVVSVRAQMITLFGFALVNYLIWRFVLGDRRSLWVLPIVFCLWANLHGGFAIGLMQLGLALLLMMAARVLPALRQTFPFSQISVADYVARIRHLIIAFGACTLASLANPYTYRVYEEALRTNLDHYARSEIHEWFSVNFQDPYGILIGAFIFLFIWWLLWTRKYHSTWHMLLLPIYLYLGMTTVRHTALLVIFVLPWLYMALATEPVVVHFFDTQVDRLFAVRRGPWFYYAYNALAVVIPLVVLIYRSVLFVTLNVDTAQLASRGGYPRAAVEFLQTHARPDDLLLNDYNWGGYLIWNLPQQKVYIDGRMSSWRNDEKHVLEEYVHIVDLAPDWMDLLQSNHVTLILTPKESRLAASLGQVASYRRVYEDDTAAIYRKS